MIKSHWGTHAATYHHSANTELERHFFHLCAKYDISFPQKRDSITHHHHHLTNKQRGKIIPFFRPFSPMRCNATPACRLHDDSVYVPERARSQPQRMEFHTTCTPQTISHWLGSFGTRVWLLDFRSQSSPFSGVLDSPLGVPRCNEHFGLCYARKPSFLFRMDACVYMYRAGRIGR
jgi:hypothetical protein